VAAECMYSRSLQDVARSIVRVKRRKEVIYLRVADVSCTRGCTREHGALLWSAPAVVFRNTTPVTTVHIEQFIDERA